MVRWPESGLTVRSQQMAQLTGTITSRSIRYTSPIDVNFNGSTIDSPFRGFDDWSAVDLRQMSARASGFGFSEGGGLKAGGGGGLKAGGGGGIDNEGGGLKAGGGGGLKAGGGGGLKAGGGGGIEQDTETANSTVSSPVWLTCTKSLNNVPGCVAASGSFVESEERSTDVAGTELWSNSVSMMSGKPRALSQPSSR